MQLPKSEQRLLTAGESGPKKASLLRSSRDEQRHAGEVIGRNEGGSAEEVRQEGNVAACVSRMEV